MRKTLFTLVTFALFVGQIIASPIDVDRAQRIGMKYLQSNYAKQVGTLSLAYTQMTESGQPALYVFNGDNSFVIVSADDAMATKEPGNDLRGERWRRRTIIGHEAMRMTLNTPTSADQQSIVPILYI